MTEAAYGDTIKELRAHANEEIQHAMILADQIDYLGGSPTVRVGKIMASQGNETMFKQKFAGEEDAIRQYKVRVEQSEALKKFALAQQLRAILATEQKHVMDLKQALGE